MPKPKTTNRNKMRNVRPQPEFEQKLVDLARVTRVVKGGKRLRFRACIIIGDQKGKIGFGIAKGTDVSIAINKAVAQAKKKLLQVDIQSETIPHEVRAKYGAAQVLLRPARKGHGLVAGGVVRVILTLAGFKNLTAKILGSDSKINNVKATMKALEILTESSKQK